MRSSETGLARNVLHCRFIVVGSGIAGLWTARRLSEYGEVTIVTKSQLCESNTEYAQGGIAVALLPADSPDLHKQDTLEAGDELCDVPAVEILTHEGPAAVRELIGIGARFDERDGKLLAGREAAHQRNRIIHANGDATGAEVERAVSEAVVSDENIRILENTMVTGIVLLHGKCVGVEAIDQVSSERLRVLAGGTLLATGGAGNLYKVTTNPPVTMGDAFALGWQAGAQLQDAEFVQFHPTSLAARGYPKFLVSEAVRGEGGVLRNEQGEAFMYRYCPEQRDLAPRDEVARAVVQEMSQYGTDHVYLDMSPIGSPEAIRERFPGITAELRERGMWDPEELVVPVTPAAHYCMGGIRSDINGQTSIPRLYACGESASCGVHGANRLASNSLLDGLVFGSRSARAMMGAPDLTEGELSSAAALPQKDLILASPDLQETIQEIISEHAGIIRDGEGMDMAARELGRHFDDLERSSHGRAEEVDTAMMLQAARLITEAARLRKESRGAHYRTDYPQQDPQWRQHIVLQRGSDDGISSSFAPVLQ